MARTFYSVVLCLTLGLLATMWLRPGIAQDLIDLAHSVVRAQSPDPQSVPQAAPFGNQPYDNMAGPPTQPTAVTRPVTWPGTPVDSYSGTVNGGNNAGVVSSYGTNPSAPRPGVTVWDPNTRTVVPAPGANSYVAPPPSNSGTPQSQPPGSAFLPHATSEGPGGLYPPNVAPPPTMQLAQAPSPNGQFPAMPPQMQPYGQTQPAAQTQPYGQPPVAQTQPYGQSPPVAQTAPYGQTPQNNSTPSGSMSATATQANGSQPYPTTATPNQQFNLPPANGQPSQPPLATGVVVQPNLNATNVQVLPGEPKDIPDSQIIARVGTEAILRSDVKAMTYAVLQQKKFDVPPEQMEQFFAMAERPLLKQLVEMKLVYNDAIHSIPAEGMKKIQAGIGDQFDKEQLPQLLTNYGVSTRQELEAKLRERSSSIEAERRSFFEKNLYSGWMREKIKHDEEVLPADVLGYYTQHTADYEFPAQAKWEELMVSFSRIADKDAAKAALVELGNTVMSGAPFAEVAKSRSDGVTASSGGIHDWTTQGSLAAKQLDAAIFGLPVGSLSQIIESDRGWHIIRVVERKEAGRKSFEDTQSEIKKSLKEQNFTRKIKTYLEDLRKKTPVWTIYDNQPGGLDGPPKE